MSYKSSNQYCLHHPALLRKVFLAFSFASANLQSCSNLAEKKFSPTLPDVTVFLCEELSYPSFVGAVHQSSEVLHPAIGVWVLEEHTAHILPAEVHLMRQLQHRLHPNVAVT